MKFEQLRPIDECPCTDSCSLEGDGARVRTAVILGVLGPLAMFVAWEAAVLGAAPKMTGAAGELMQVCCSDQCHLSR